MNIAIINLVFLLKTNFISKAPPKHILNATILYSFLVNSAIVSNYLIQYIKLLYQRAHRVGYNKNVIVLLLTISFDITRQKDVPHFYKWWVPISATGGGRISPASLKRSGSFFAKSAKNLKVKILL